jgi:hypothetical protein
VVGGVGYKKFLTIVDINITGSMSILIFSKLAHFLVP